MERRTSLGAHLSLSTSNIASPLAESTQINGSSMQTKFPWGGKMSPAKGLPPNNGISSIQRTLPKAALSPVRKIDPRVYTDVQSNGLTSRIVRYHENSSKLNRSTSVGNLYDKPGQFPVVHLKRSEMQVKPKRNPSISVVRIAPPDKTLYQVSARSSILRGGSNLPPMALEKSGQKDSCENRPILPPAENDVNPTRSVLDALKEISRKRINSDGMNGSDNIKKYCKEPEEEPRRNLHLPLVHQVNQSHQVSVITKRQREIPSPTESKTSSPESINTAAKKRVCTKNNDISSSLSSSLLFNTPKRKLQDVHGRPPVGRYSPSSSSLAPPQAKQHCNDRNFVIADSAEVDSAFKYPPDQLTPIPATPAYEFVPEKLQREAEKLKPPKPAPQKPKLTLFDKDYDTTQVIERGNNEAREPEEEGIAGISFIKPKKNSPVFTGKNALIERVQTSKLSLMLSCLSGELNDDDDEVDSKRSEKQQPELVSSDNQTTGTSVVVATSSATSLAAPKSDVSNAVVSVVATSAPTMSSDAASTTATTSAPSFSFGLKTTDQTPATSSVASSKATPIKPMLSFGTTSTTSVSCTATVSTTSVVNFATKQQHSETVAPSVVSSVATATTTPAMTTPVKGFPFGQQETSVAQTISSISTPAIDTMPSTALFGFGAAKPLGSSSSSAASPNTTPAPAPPAYTATSMGVSSANSALSFGVPTASQSQSKPLFSFGTGNANSSTSVTTSAISTAPTFSLGTVTSQPLPMFGSNAASIPSNATPQSAIPSFGAANQQQAPPVFGSVGSAFTSTSSTIKSSPKFGESGNAFGTSSQVASNAGGFSFSGASQPGQTTGPSLFGTATNATTTTTAALNPSPFSFGTSTANKTATSPQPFIFSSSNATNNSAIPSFGALTTTAAAAAPTSQTPFAFGQSTGNTKQPATTQSTQFSFQAPAQKSQTSNASFNFGSNTASNPAPFGFGSCPPQTTTTSFSFSGGSAPSAFTTMSGAKPATGGFAFNASSAAATENKSVFGSTGLQPTNQFSFSASKPVDQPQPTAAFGASAPLASNTFGSSAPPASNTFGSPAMASGKLFSFGSAAANNNASATTNQTTNLFGSPAANNTSSTPLFPAAANIAPLPFGAKSNLTTATASPVFNFSSSAGSATSNPNSGAGGGAFAFGAAATQPQNTNKPFGFGASAAPAASGNPFGSTVVANKPPAFNFAGNAGGVLQNGGNNNSSSNPLVPAGNPFAPIGTAPGSKFSSIPPRDIRTATRRLKPK